jgi:hypothetical protein
VSIGAGHFDVRLPAPADFDTLWRTRQLLGGAVAWDPLASLAAVVTRIAAADTLSTVRVMRLALVALTAAAAGGLIVEAFGLRSRISPAVVTALALIALAPWAPLTTWAIVLLLFVGTMSLIRGFRSRRPEEGWHASAAIVLAAAHVMPFSNRPGVLWQVSRTAQYLEHRAATQETLQLVRLPLGDDWVLVGPPEQELELDGRGRFYDLARFVARFHDRAGDPSFRFDLGGSRLFVFVEKQPFDVSRPLPHARFVVEQPVAYRVSRERARLERRARQICDEYSRTHAGAAIEYDGAELRVYRFDV